MGGSRKEGRREGKERKGEGEGTQVHSVQIFASRAIEILYKGWKTQPYFSLHCRNGFRQRFWIQGSEPVFVKDL